jgi:hypothetical protein
MMILRFLRSYGACALTVGALACHRDSTPPPEYPAMPSTSTAPAPAAAAPLPAAKGKPGTELAGEWVEFWALSGGADTQRYVFSGDGHFEWTAAESSKDGVLAMFGEYSFDGSNVLLSVKAERPRDSKCKDGCKTPVEPARAVQLSVEDCPPNEEARALDASYRCLSFGDHAFWLRARPVNN